MSTRAHDVHPVVVRCPECRAAVDRSSAETCPFCGTDLASAALLGTARTEPPPKIEQLTFDALPVEESPPVVVGPVVVPRRERERRRFVAAAVLLVVATSVGVLTAVDFRPVARVEHPTLLPTAAVPVFTTVPSGKPASTSRPVQTAAPSADKESTAAPVGCDFFTQQELDREYAFQISRSDLAYERARENSEHVFKIDHDRKANDKRMKAAGETHAAEIAGINKRMGRATGACDPQLLV